MGDAFAAAAAAVVVDNQSGTQSYFGYSDKYCTNVLGDAADFAKSFEYYSYFVPDKGNYSVVAVLVGSCSHTVAGSMNTVLAT